MYISLAAIIYIYIYVYIYIYIYSHLDCVFIKKKKEDMYSVLD